MRKHNQMESLCETETLISVPSLKYPLKIVHITDCHLTEINDRDDEIVREYGQKRKTAFQQRHFEAQAKLFEQMIDLCNQEDVDASVWTGDIIDFPSCGNLDNISQHFAKLHSPYLYTLGNHDWQHGHDPINDETRKTNYRYFRSWLTDYPGFQMKRVGGVRLVAIDNSNYQLEESQWRQLLDLLECDEPWLLFMHIPVFLPALEQAAINEWGAPILMSAASWTPEVRSNWHVKKDTPYTRLFTERLKAGKLGQLSGIFCGHVHFPFEEAFWESRKQYVTGPGFAGQYRLIRLVPE